MLSTYERVIRNHHAHKSESGILRLAIYYMYGSTYKECMGLALLCHSLLVHGFHLCIYCMEGYCLHGIDINNADTHTHTHAPVAVHVFFGGLSKLSPS